MHSERIGGFARRPGGSSPPCFRWMATHRSLALHSGCCPASMAAPPILVSALPQPVVLRASSFRAPADDIVEHREYRESRLLKKSPQTPGGRELPRLASGHGDKVVLLERPR